MLKTKVKVGSVTNLSEARYCAGMGVDYLSFPVAAVDPKTYQEITGWVAGPQFGIEAETYSEILDRYPVDFIQTSGDAMAGMPAGTKVIVGLSANRWAQEKEQLITSKNKILLLELTASPLDEGAKSMIMDASREFEVFIKFSANNSLEEILALPISGISLDGSAEVKAGLKEYPLAEILEKLEDE